jgi:GrpB-like predicted nucleotidyltransferase (UPF0157 family)
MDEIEIIEYDPRWPALFAEEAALLRAALDPDLVVGLEHFGSTAIPGLAAKPIIDILVAVRSLAEARRSAIEPLQRLGYVFWTENPKADRMFFVKGMSPFGERWTHHVHFTEPTAEPWLPVGASRGLGRAAPPDGQKMGHLTMNRRNIVCLPQTSCSALFGLCCGYSFEGHLKAPTRAKPQPT